MTSANSGVGRQVKDLFGKYSHPTALVPVRMMGGDDQINTVGKDHNIFKILIHSIEITTTDKLLKVRK